MVSAKCGTASIDALPIFWCESNQPIMSCQRWASKSSPNDEDHGNNHMMIMITVTGKGVIKGYLYWRMIISYSKKELRCFISFCMIVERIVVVADIWRGGGGMPG